MKSFKSRCTLLLISPLLLTLSGCQSVTSTTIKSDTGILPKKTDYPHWDFNNTETYNKLVKINTFIEKHRNKGETAVFDWDGTLYSEQIPCELNGNIPMCGQSVYLISTAAYAPKFCFDVFPTFKTQDSSLFDNVKTMTNYLEHHTNAASENPAHTFLYAIFFATMTPIQVAETVDVYLTKYSVEDFMFHPVFDVLQKMINSDINVFIVTGSNEYLLSAMLNKIQNVDYSGSEKYQFPKSFSGIPYNKSNGHIIGNSPCLNESGHFLNISDYSWTKNSEGDLYVVGGYGKEIVMKNIEKKENTKIVFVAGNNNGDFLNTQYVVKQEGTLAMAINPRGDDYKKLVEKYSDKIISISCN